MPPHVLFAGFVDSAVDVRIGKLRPARPDRSIIWMFGVLIYDGAQKFPRQITIRRQDIGEHVFDIEI